MQDKTNTVAENYKIGLNIHRSKRKILKVNATSTTPIKLKKARRLKRWRALPILAALWTSKEGEMPM
jgi:hypothetical protein